MLLAQSRRQQRLDLRADAAEQQRRGAVGTDADGDVATFDDGGNEEIGKLGAVHDVDQGAAGPGGRGDLFIQGTAGRADHQAHAIEQSGGEGACPMDDAALFGEAGDFGIGFGGDNGDGRLGLQQQPDLAGGILAAADHQHRPVPQDQKTRETLHGRASRPLCGTSY